MLEPYLNSFDHFLEELKVKEKERKAARLRAMRKEQTMEF